MLHIHYKPVKNMVRTVRPYFDNTYMDEWFNDDFVKQMVLDVDKSVVIAEDCVRSPVLGTIPVTKISGGVKALILMYKCPELVIWATACGDNCSKWILEIAKHRDLHIVLEHIMEFPTDFEAICHKPDNKQVRVTNLREYKLNALKALYMQD